LRRDRLATGLAATARTDRQRLVQPPTIKECTMAETMMDLPGVIAASNGMDFLRANSGRRKANG